MAKVDKTNEVIVDPSANVESVELDDIFDNEEESSTDSYSIPAYGLDSIDLEMDSETVARLESSLFLPTGTYTWKAEENNPRVSVSFSTNDFNSKDIKAKEGKGRCFINLSGIVVNTKTKKEGRFQFGMSPDQRLFPNSDDDDTITKNYSRFLAFYFRHTEQKGKNPSKVTALAASSKHAMYITESKGVNYLNKVQERGKD